MNQRRRHIVGLIGCVIVALAPMIRVESHPLMGGTSRSPALSTLTLLCFLQLRIDLRDVLLGVLLDRVDTRRTADVDLSAFVLHEEALVDGSSHHRTGLLCDDGLGGDL